MEDLKKLSSITSEKTLRLRDFGDLFQASHLRGVEGGRERKKKKEESILLGLLLLTHSSPPPPIPSRFSYSVLLGGRPGFHATCTSLKLHATQAASSAGT